MKRLINFGLGYEEIEVRTLEECEHKDYCISKNQNLSKCLYGYKCYERTQYNNYGEGYNYLGVGS